MRDLNSDPASDIANEEMLSLCLVEPALYCILDPYFQTGSHFQMVNCKNELHVPKTVNLICGIEISVIIGIVTLNFSTCIVSLCSRLRKTLMNHDIE